MVRDEVRDGERVARLLSSEVHGRRRGVLGRLSVVDADPDVEPRPDGTFAYAIAIEADGEGESDGTGADDDAGAGETGTGDAEGSDETGADDDAESDVIGEDDAESDGTRRRIASVFAEPDRVRVEFVAGAAAAVDAVDAAESAGLRLVSSEEGRVVADAGVDHPDPVAVSVENGAAVKPALRVVRAVAEAVGQQRGEL